MAEQISEGDVDSPLCRVAWPTSSIPSASSECALHSGPSVPLSPSTHLYGLLLSRGKVLNLISIAYFTKIMRSMPHSITKCSSAVASLFVSLIFRITSQRDRHIDWEIFHFHQSKKRQNSDYSALTALGSQNYKNATSSTEDDLRILCIVSNCSRKQCWCVRASQLLSNQ